MKKSTKDSQKSNLKIKFTKKLMTAYGGFYLLGRLFDSLKLKENLESIFPAKEESNNGTGIYSKLLSYGLTVIAGGKRFAHTMYLGESREVYEEIFGVAKMVKSYSAITRLFDKVDSWSQSEKLAEGLWEYTFKMIPENKNVYDWLTFDSTVLTKYGEQQGAKKGYNPKKKGIPSHHPLLAFLNTQEYVVNYWNRAGNASSGENIVDFANQTLIRLGDKVKLRGSIADTGFYDVKFFELLENKKLEYIIGVPMFQILQKEIHKISNWTKIDTGLDSGEFKFCHKDEKWTTERRYVVIRRDTTKIDAKHGKQLSLFANDVSMRDYKYSIYITNLDDSPEKVWKQYRLRANDENIIKETKYDFALEGFSKDNFWSTEAAMLLRIFFFNIINLFRKEILPSNESNETLHTLRFKYLCIPAVLGTDARASILRLGIRSLKLKSKFKYALNHIDVVFPEPI